MGFSLGSALGKVNDFIGVGGSSQTNAASLLTPEQQKYLAEYLPTLFGNATSGSNPLLDSMLGTQRTSAEQNFQQNTLPQIMAGTGTLHSSATGNKIGQLYNNMQMGLTSNESQMKYNQQQQNISNLLAALGIKGTENITTTSQGPLSELLGAGVAAGKIYSSFGGGA